jgi:hypothetical protein
MSGVRHPVSHALYELQADGHVKVSQDGQEGVFDRDGRWICGDLEEADLHMVIYAARTPAPTAR